MGPAAECNGLQNEHSTGRGSPLGSWLGVVLIALAATAPFLSKAFHIDDALYLAVARQILREPLDPFGAEVLWEKRPESLFDADFNPPLWNYMMAAVLAVTGEPTVEATPDGETEFGTPRFRVQSSRTPEIALHLLEGVFVATAVAGLYVLGRRWVRWPLAATALVVLSPAMLPGINVMLEGPVMTFWIWGMWCHLRAIERDDVRWTCASSLFAALGVMTKYTSGVVILLLICESVRRRHWRSLWFLAAPLAALAIWSLHNWLVYERLHVLVMLSRAQTGERHSVGIQFSESFGRVFAMIRSVGAVTALALPVTWILGRRFGTWVVLLLLAASLGVGFAGEWDMRCRLDDRGQKLQEPGRIHAVVFGTLGNFALGGLAASALVGRRARLSAASGHDTLLAIWLAAMIGFGIFGVPFLAVRHLLPGMPPLVWLVLRELEATKPPGRVDAVGRWVVGLTVLISSTCGFLVAKADYDFAHWYRHMAVNRAAHTVAVGRLSNVEVWFTGHWGWAYYADRVGMKPFVPGRSGMRAGDLLLMPLIQTWESIPEEFRSHVQGRMQTIKPRPLLTIETGIAAIDHWADLVLNSVRSISTEVHYYSGGTLNLPWQFSRKPLDDFAVIEVIKDMPTSE